MVSQDGHIDERTESALIVTLDGPAGSGKSSVARELARRLGVAFLDTGAMYRGLAVACLDHQVDPANDSLGLERLAHDLAMHFDWSQDPPQLWVNGNNVTDRLRDYEVTAMVGTVATNAHVRKLMVQWQREIAKKHPRLVTEGRDQGSVVFPNAQVRFYLVASPLERAKRRARELQADGKTAHVEDILESIQKRDAQDMARAISPLVKPQGAIELDTSHLTFDQVVDRLYQWVIEAIEQR